MFKKTTVAVSLCLALGAAGNAMADLFAFDPTGGGSTTNQITTLDWAPGNTVGINGNPPGAGLVVGSTVQDLFQANLGTAYNGTPPTQTNVFANGTGGAFFTVVAGFSEAVTSVSFTPGVQASATFNDTAAPQPSFFRICLQSTTGNDLTGAGFACTNANAILTGTLSNIVSANQSIDFSNPVVPLDNFLSDGNNWGAQTTVQSSGAASIQVRVISVNAGYFPDLFPGSTIVTALSNTSLITPFSQADPSYCFSSNGTTSSTSGTSTCTAGTFQAFGTLGSVNGLPALANGGVAGPNFLFQADANTTITRAAVPEPGTLALMGLGLAMVSVLTRPRRKGS
jgi:hypothetical protein